MSQPILKAILSLGVAGVLTAAVAVAASASKMQTRVMQLAAIGAAIAVIVSSLQRTDVKINFTGSMPVGIYVLRPLPLHQVKRGMLAVACAPARAAAIGLRRGYLTNGPCPGGTELVLKSVAAVAGDEIDVTAAGVIIDGCLLPHSRPVARDSSGRALMPWSPDHYRLAPDRIWLYADDNRSWDSRYWGPTSISDVVAIANPLAVAGAAVPATLPNQARRRCRHKSTSSAT